jgi:hypothetical protein
LGISWPILRLEAPDEKRQPVPLLDPPETLEEPVDLVALAKHLCAPREAVVDVVDPTFNEHSRPTRHR